MFSNLLELLACPKSVAGVRCGGSLAEIENKLFCQRCNSTFPIVKGVPVLREVDETEETAWYETAYSARSRTQDLAEDAHAGGRRITAEIVAAQKVVGPTLDIGCGTGIFAAILPGFVGLDYSVEAITSKGTEEYAFVCGTAEGLPFRDNTFGCVFSIDALEHVPRVDIAFEEIDRVVRPGGHVVLKPAWHCTRYQTELLPIKPYSELRAGQKFTKAMLPVLTSRPYKLATFLPRRLWRRAFAGKPSRLAFKPLTPNFSEWIADSDASASIDCHEAILFFESRGYENLSHQSLKKRLLAGHDWVVMRKPGAGGQSHFETA